MKKMIFSLLAILCMSMNMNAMSISKASREARFLTDKMAYELNLTDEQYEDAYEINYDYFRSLGSVNDYYDSEYDLRYRNLEYVLDDWQWRLFVARDYFLNPVRILHGAWDFLIYNHYRPSHYYYAAPRCFHSYHGGHATHYYMGRHDIRPNHRMIDRGGVSPRYEMGRGGVSPRNEIRRNDRAPRQEMGRRESRNREFLQSTPRQTERGSVSSRNQERRNEGRSESRNQSDRTQRAREIRR